MPILLIDPPALSESADYGRELMFVLSVRLVTGGRVAEFSELLSDIELSLEVARFVDDDVIGAAA